MMQFRGIHRRWASDDIIYEWSMKMDENGWNQMAESHLLVTSTEKIAENVKVEQQRMKILTIFYYDAY